MQVTENRNDSLERGLLSCRDVVHVVGERWSVQDCADAASDIKDIGKNSLYRSISHFDWFAADDVSCPLLEQRLVGPVASNPLHWSKGTAQTDAHCWEAMQFTVSTRQQFACVFGHCIESARKRNAFLRQHLVRLIISVDRDRTDIEESLHRQLPCHLEYIGGAHHVNSDDAPASPSLDIGEEACEDRSMHNPLDVMLKDPI